MLSNFAFNFNMRHYTAAPLQSSHPFAMIDEVTAGSYTCPLIHFSSLNLSHVVTAEKPSRTPNSNSHA